MYAPSRPPGAPRRLLGGEFSEALVDLRRRRAYIPRENASIPAIETTLTIDRGGLASEAEVELLGELLAPLFADEAGFEATSLLTIQLNPTGERRSWPQEVP